MDKSTKLDISVIVLPSHHNQYLKSRGRKHRGKGEDRSYYAQMRLQTENEFSSWATCTSVMLKSHSTACIRCHRGKVNLLRSQLPLSPTVHPTVSSGGGTERGQRESLAAGS